MPCKLMDFNPLDLLAATALGEKDASSNVNSVRGGQAGPSDSSHNFEESEGTKDADKMGRTTINALYSNSIVYKEVIKMPPSKAPWGPEGFLSSDLESPRVYSKELNLDDLVNDLKKRTQLDKPHNAQIMTDSIHNNNSFIECKMNGFNNNIITMKNGMNSGFNVLSDASPRSTGFESPPSVQSMDNDRLRLTEVPTDNSEQGSPSDTDTADSDSKSSEPAEPAEIPVFDSVSMDHCYTLLPGQTHPPPHYMDFYDDDVDICSQSGSPLTEETEQRSRNLSLDCNYLKSGIMEGVSASTLDLYKMSYSLGRSKLPSSSSSISSPTFESNTKQVFSSGSSPIGAGTSGESMLSSPTKFGGKFRIGTYASFSSSNLELEKYLRNKDLANGNNLNVGIPSETNSVSSALNSPIHKSVHPFLQSPSLDWDRSEVTSEIHDDSSDGRTPKRLSPDVTTEKVTEWSHPLFHDHDYCMKESKNKNPIEDSGSKTNTGKRKYTKRKLKKESVINHEKMRNAKYLKEELLKFDLKRPTPSSKPSAVEPAPESEETMITKPDTISRGKKRSVEKMEEEEIVPESGTKMKITGKFSDQFVYSLPKSSRTTTRRLRTPSLPFLSDKIIVPAPKPGDIIVPHLTDADVAAVRQGGRAALNPIEKPDFQNSVPTSVSSGTTQESISDVDSHIVSTILSMESDIGSPASSQPSDISSVADFNPDQPALTESLRQISGDSSITSEHVLNFLLSVVKDEDDTIVDSSAPFDTTSSSFFSPIPSDPIFSKADTTQEPMSISGRHMVTSNSSPSVTPTIKTEDDSSAQSSTEKEESKLSDDLSSLISDSQGIPTSSSNLESESRSIKNMFGNDLSSGQTSQVSSPVPRFENIEKTLDYLGVKDGEIQLDNNEVFNTKLNLDMNPSQIISTDDDTPWIVTVTLYCNDIPAIMINNQPYIRLVDIHKQILPAKDTGILKKRCQLLKIPVMNCTEMQRYFLVQYGRAYNSKSSLVISKDQATELVSYYASPQPRAGRNEEVSSVRSRSRGSESGGNNSPITVNGAFNKKKSAKAAKKSSTVHGHSVGEVSRKESLAVLATASPGGTSSKRTRHKKVNYLDMLRGEEKVSEDSSKDTIESVARSEQNGKKSRSSDRALKKKNKSKDKKLKKSKSEKAFKLKKNSKGSKGGKEKLAKNSLGDKVFNIKGKKSKVNSKLNEDVIPSEVDSDESVDSDAGLKFRPLKLKMNSLFSHSTKKGLSPPKKGAGLFSRSNSASSTSSPRILSVAHQSTLTPDTESHLPLQPADIHLDLFTHSSSPCVRCQTCSQFLSVPDFMRHHHVAMDNKWLATEAEHRMLVPRNKENISELEKRLWEDFHRLQADIGGFGADEEEEEGEEEDDDEETESENELGHDEDDDESVLDVSGTSSSLRSVARSPSPIGQDDAECSEQEEDEVDGDKKSPHAIRLMRRSQKMKDMGLVKRDSCNDIVHNSVNVNGVSNNNSMSFLNLRTSSRKRKSKQLFSIENYHSSPKKGLNCDEEVVSH